MNPFALLGPHARFGDNLSPKRECGSKQNYLELELTCPQNGCAILNKLLGIIVNLSPTRECGFKQIN